MLKKLAVSAAVVCMLVLAACAGITNPINNNSEASAESAYITAAGLETTYLALAFCPAGTHFAVTAPCKETSIIRQVKADDNVAYTALLQVRAFQKANPGNTVGLSSLVTAAISAAQALQAVIPLKTGA
jgi:ABC-type glycerol-3-phosphate transport system substrate-binding protein